MSLTLPVQHRFLSSLERNPGLWAACIITVSLAVRLAFVLTGQLNLVQDEAQYWDWSRTLQLSYYSKGPMVAWVIAFWTAIFGDTELGVRMGALVNATLVQILLWHLLARLMRRPRLAALALLVANTMPLFLASGILMTTDNILMVCWLGAMICLYALTAGESGRRPSPSSGYPSWCLPGLALCMAVGNMGKYMMLAFFGTAVLYLWLLRRHRLVSGGLIARILLAMSAGAVIGYIPILVWNIRHDFVGFLHVGSLAGVTGAKAARLFRLDTPLEFLGGQFGVATPWWMFLMLFTGWRAVKAAWQGHCPHDDPLREKTAPEQTRQYALMAAAFWPVWLGMFLWSFHARIYANWTGMSYVGGIMLAAAGLERLLAGYGSARARRFAPAWVCLGVVCFVLVFSSPLLPLPSSANPTARLKGWADMGRKLESLAADLPDSARVFYFSDNYDVTAELAFYGPDQPEAYSAYFGRRHSQYDLWPGPADPLTRSGAEAPDRTGWDALYVTARSSVPKELEAMFDKVEVLPYVSSHRGRPARAFVIAVLHNFKGHWPKIDNERY